MNDLLLGVNIDHVATLRQARQVSYPSVLRAALMAESAGADLITIHLREDRRHIQDSDICILKRSLTKPINLEIAATEEMVGIACTVKPSHVCIVPENRAEVTTEGGFDCKRNYQALKDSVAACKASNIEASVFIDPNQDAIDACLAVNADAIELHTGSYADAVNPDLQAKELDLIKDAAFYAAEKGLRVNAGHGLTLNNTPAVAQIPVISELNIGHSIIAESIFFGLDNVIKMMRKVMFKARS